MAVFTPISSTRPNNKRSGVTFFSSVAVPGNSSTPATYRLNGRSTAVPLQPQTLIQASAQNVLATVAQTWAALSPEEQAGWADGYNGLTGYTYYTAIATYWITWGFRPPPLPSGYGVFGANLFLNSTWPGGTSPYTIMLEMDGGAPGQEVWAALYLQTSNFVPSYSSGLSAVSGAGIAPLTGYVYIGYVGPLTNLVALEVDITDIVLTLYGQFPMETISEPDQYRYYGSGLGMQAVLNDGTYGLWLSEYVELPSPEVSFYVVPFTFGAQAIPTALATAARLTRLAPVRTKARFFPSMALRKRVNQTRRGRGDPGISRDQARAGWGVGAFRRDAPVGQHPKKRPAPPAEG